MSIERRGSWADSHCARVPANGTTLPTLVHSAPGTKLSAHDSSRCTLRRGHRSRGCVCQRSPSRRHRPATGTRGSVPRLLAAWCCDLPLSHVGVIRSATRRRIAERRAPGPHPRNTSLAAPHPTSRLKRRATSSIVWPECQTAHRTTAACPVPGPALVLSGRQAASRYLQFR